MTDGTVRLERRGAVAIVTIDRTGRRNAMNRAMWAALGEAADQLAAKPPRAVVLTGAGGVFSAGMDVNPDNPMVAELVASIGSPDAPGDEAPVRRMLAEIHTALDRLYGLPVPIIAAVGGLAYGGGAEIATRCDLRVADANAVFCFSEVRLGLMPDLGGGVALGRLIGRGRATDLILSARKVGPEEALQLGLVNRVAPAGGALDAGIAMAEAIAANGPRAVRAALAIQRTADDRPLEAAIAAEVAAATALIASGECQVGINALLTRTTPAFPDPE